MKRILASLIFVWVFSGTASNATQIVQAKFVCSRGVALQVAFFDDEAGGGLAVMAFEGKLVVMQQYPSASGARYIAIDEQDSYRLYIKSENAFVAWLAADDSAKEAILLDNCRSDPVE